MRLVRVPQNAPNSVSAKFTAKAPKRENIPGEGPTRVITLIGSNRTAEFHQYLPALLSA